MLFNALDSHAQFVDVVIDFAPTVSLQLLDNPELRNPIVRSGSKNSILTWVEISLPATVTAGITFTSERLAEAIPATCLTLDANHQISDPQTVTYGTTFYPANSAQGKTNYPTARQRTYRVWIGLPPGIPVEVTIAYL